MDTHVWSFLLVVALCSAIGYFLLKRYAAYHIDKKTRRLIDDFRKETGLQTDDRPPEVIEKELLCEAKPDNPDSRNDADPEEPSKGVDEPDPEKKT